MDSEKMIKDRQPVYHDTEQQIIRQWETLGICNDFIFCKIMMDRELLEELVKLILPDIRFTELKVQSQKPIEVGMDVHGVRFDIYAQGEDGTVIEIEMQVLDTGNLPKRFRFYSSMIDTEMLEKGVSYSKLRDSYIIIIAPFDQYGKGLHKYTFTNRAKEDTELEMGDGSTKIFLNAAGTADDVKGRLKAFLDYVAGNMSDDEYVKKLDAAVRRARQNKEWRREYMTLVMRDLENQEIGIKKGIEKGIEKGRKDMILSMLRKGKTPQDIADFCDADLSEIESVQEEMLVAK